MDSDIIDISMDFDNLDTPMTKNIKTNFGGGIELLMNDKKKDTIGKSSDIDIEELNNLESELNELAQDTNTEPITNNFASGDIFGLKTDFIDKPTVRFDDTPTVRFNEPSIGEQTSHINSDNKTWDGYGKFNNIPINPDKSISNEPKLTKEELLREKFKYLRKLEALEKKGIELTKKYNMDSPLSEMQGEYEMIMEEKNKHNSIKFQANILMTIINGIEFLNNRFDPFDIKLDGWGEQVNENISDYDEIFGELHEKYKSKASLAPELKLLFQLGGSAMMVHMTNTMFKSAMPGMDDILRQNPDLMRQFQNAAVSSMSNSNPGFSGFMSGLMNPEPQIPQSYPTQGPNAIPPPANRGGNSTARPDARPDITMARSSVVNDGISIKENFGINGLEPPQPAERTSRRPEMKGPTDLTDILSGLKTKTINIAENNNNSVANTNNSSTISIDDLKSIQSDVNVPKRSRRRQKSDKNTVSLDI
jgi:hypothetical protein